MTQEEYQREIVKLQYMVFNLQSRISQLDRELDFERSRRSSLEQSVIMANIQSDMESGQMDWSDELLRDYRHRIPLW